MSSKPVGAGGRISPFPLSNARRVGIVGGNHSDSASLRKAEKMGRLIAANHYVLVTGGRGGIMEASSRGAHEAGGFVIGILPGSDRREANPWVDLAISTGIGSMRNAMVALNSDCLVAIDGGYGTLSEIAYGNIFALPVFGLGTWQIPGVDAHESPESILSAIRKHLEGKL